MMGPRLQKKLKEGDFVPDTVVFSTQWLRSQFRAQVQGGVQGDDDDRLQSPGWRRPPSAEALKALDSVVDGVHAHLRLLLAGARSIREARASSKKRSLKQAVGNDVWEGLGGEEGEAFIARVEQWSSRRRKFTDAFETILESVGAPKKKMADDIGVEFDPEPAAARLGELRKLVDQIKRKRAVEARKKKFKTNHA